MRQALILAGGQGTRLASRLNGAPKPLVKIDGTPLLQRQLAILAQHDIEHVLVMANYRIEALAEYCSSLRFPKMQVDIVADSGGPRGTAGAVYDAAHLLAPTFLVLYGDTLLDVDLHRFWRSHLDASRSFGALGSLFLHPNDHPHDSDLVDMDHGGVIRAFHPKPHRAGQWHRNLVNAALYILERDLLARVAIGRGVVDFGKDMFPAALAQGIPLHGYATFEYIKDIGTPERLDRAEADLRSGKVARSRLGQPQKAVFLDRDGTLNRPAGHIASPAALELIDGVGEAVSRLNRAEYRCVMVTNQPVLARGECDTAGLDRIHAKLETVLGQHGAFLDASYVCPHHPDKGFPGEVPELKRVCDCRKPAPGMVLQAQSDLGIDLAQSWMVGDSEADIGAARAGGVRSVLVRTGNVVATMLPVEPDYEVADLPAAVILILDQHQALRAKLQPIVDTLSAGMVVRIAGQSRQGKSLIASMLREMLTGRSLCAAHVRLDRWLRSPACRQTGAAPRDHFDWALLTEQLGPWFGGDSLETDMPCYDPAGLARCRGAQLRLPHDGILIADGTFAFDVAPDTPRRSMNLFIDGDEPQRATRFLAEYCRRGLAPEEAEALYSQRRADEFPAVEAQRIRADQVLSVPCPAMPDRIPS